MNTQIEYFKLLQNGNTLEIENAHTGEIASVNYLISKGYFVNFLLHRSGLGEAQIELSATTPIDLVKLCELLKVGA